MAETKAARRYYLRMRLAEDVLDCPEQASVWRAKQEAEPGVVLPSTFPHRARLIAAGYGTVEDIDGADVAELQRSGFYSREAEAILQALAEL